MNRTTLISAQDSSINVVEEALEGFIESRYVRKADHYFICYLSSQSGCNKGCRFCHLTNTKQTKFENVSVYDYLAQARNVFKHYQADSRPPAKYVHYNFMARGEALANPLFVSQTSKVFSMLGGIAEGLGVKFNVSTIMPKGIVDSKGRQINSLIDIFPYIHPTIYFSLYSTDVDFRKRWMPQAMSLLDSLPILREYQQFSKKRIKIHHALIKNVNDSIGHARLMTILLEDHGIDWDFNLVRYNPFSADQGEEASQDTVDAYLDIVRQYCPGKVQIIPRVGFDVKASCGMFVEK